MSIVGTAGNFNASKIKDLVIAQESIFDDPQSNNELHTDITSAQAVLENQMVRLNPVLTNGKCIGVQVASLRDCNDSVVDRLVRSGNETSDYTNKVSCAVTGTQLRTTSITLNPNYQRTKSYTVYDDDCKDVYDYLTQLAFAIERGKAALEADYSGTVVGLFASEATPSGFTYSDFGSDNAGIFEYDAEFFIKYPFKVLSEFKLHAQLTNIRNPIILSGSPFNREAYAAGFQNQPGCCDANKLMLNDWKMYFDPATVDVAASAPTAFLFDAGAFAGWSTTQWQNTTPQAVNDDKNSFVWKEESRRLFYKDGNSNKPIAFDVIMQRTCGVDTKSGAAANKRIWATHIEIQLTAGLFALPSGCDDSETGVIQFEKVAAGATT